MPRITIKRGRHASYIGWLRTLRALRWRGPIRFTAVLHSRPLDVVEEHSDACLRQSSKIGGRTNGLASPQARSIRLACRLSDENVNAWELRALWHGPEHEASWVRRFIARFRRGLTRVPKLRTDDGTVLLALPGDTIACTIAQTHADGRPAILVTATVTTRLAGTEVTRTGTALIDNARLARWGVPLPVHAGGDCPASAPLTVTIEKP